MRKPAFIAPIQKVKAGVVCFAGVSLDETQGADNLYPVDAFHAGLAEMDEEDYRQFELTPENAVAIVHQANAAIASKKLDKKLRMNYGHDHSGPNAGEIVRVELTPEGGVRNIVRWTTNAQTAIRNGEWDGTSPEFRAKVVLDEKGKPKEVNGRVLMQPFELCGGALHNHASMPDLAIAANTEAQPDTGKEETVDMKKLALKLGLPETTTPEDVEKALDEKLKPATSVVEPVTVEAVAAAVLAKIDPDKLAAGIMEGAVAKAKEAIRAENHETACVEAVDGAIRGGRVKKSEREQALKLAKMDLEAFKTMTASMKVVAPVSPIYQASGEQAPGSVDENDPGNDEAFIEAAEKRAAEKKIPILQAARELRVEALAK